MAASLNYTLHHYGSENYLQQLGVWEIDHKNKYWVIYVHGGAWRDPRILHETFTASIDQILGSSSPKTEGLIAGFASIDYRLSPHDEFPQDAATTPAFEYRGARHPDHLDDVRAALVYLQQTYGFGSNYLLLGHSAGGALAFQLIATSTPDAGTVQPALPAVIIGLEGLYDFTGINERFGRAYTSFFNAAFGEGPAGWDNAAPYTFSGNFAEKWTGGKLVLLAWSPDETLIDEPEADNMAKRLLDRDEFVRVSEKGRVAEGAKSVLLLKDLKGDHHEIWRSGEHVARVVWIAFQKLGFDV